MSYYGKLLLLRFPWPRVTAIFLTRTPRQTHTHAPFNPPEIQISRVSIYYLTTTATTSVGNGAVKIFFNQHSRPSFLNRRPNIQIFIHVTAIHGLPDLARNRRKPRFTTGQKVSSQNTKNISSGFIVFQLLPGCVSRLCESLASI